MKSPAKFCDGITRRDFLRIGAASVMGVDLTLTGLLRNHAQAAAARSDVSVIYVFLKGGMSTIDTFDLKPDAPSEIRGEFKAIPSNVPGIQVGEQLPRVARQMDKFSLIRSFTHRSSDHGPADHYMLTGYFPLAGFNGGLKPNNHFPSFGSVIAHKLGPRGSVPPYVCLPTMHPSGGSSFLGASAVPFVIEADPSAPNFSVPDMAPPLSIEIKRLEARRELLAQVDRFQKSAEAQANAGARNVSAFSQRAFDLMTSAQAKQAFDLGAEPEKLRDEYGRNTLGQSCLMARRLVEAGVRCVTIEHSNWDTHDGNFKTLKDQLLPKFDAAVSALFRDLADRGMLGTTLVILSGEFGRTPRINKNAGRDHWGKCFTVGIGGGGIQGGRVIGASDKWAEAPSENPCGPEDLAATMYHLLGLNPRDEMITPEGRPIMLANNGRVMSELL
ncbi:MAG: DUF1501 domain-containing protein [Verrucomicrobia bacterium]|nr:DUF1501 domain-containing protein [Verrucomicrobiota bacterium]